MQADVIRKMRRLLPTLIAATLAITYLIVDPTGADLPAQLFRAKLFGVEGFGIWNNWWYAGHNVTGYSVLFPPLAWLTSPQLIAAIASVGTAAAFEALAHDSFGDDAWLGASWLGAATVTELLSGRLTFAFGLCGAALVALALSRRRPGLALLAAFLTSLASPVAALFAALAGATAVTLAGRHVLTRGSGGRAGLGVVLLALAPVVALAIVFPEGGSQPFAFSTLWPLLVAGAILAGAAQRGGAGTGAGSNAITVTTGLYLAGCLLAFAISTPVGANAARLGELVAGPLAALLLIPRRRYLLLAVVALPLTYVQVHDAIGDLQHGWRSPYDSAGYYGPLIRFLDAQPGAGQHAWRVEVPFTQGHWEADRLALEFPLARGWERQLDIADNALFYDGGLSAARYRGWLRRMAVRYVAVAAGPVDYSAKAEVRLIAAGLPFLKRLASPGHWTVYEVSDPSSIVAGAGASGGRGAAATQTGMGANWLKLTFSRPGSALVRIRFSPYWKLSGVEGCVAPAGAFTKITASTAGAAELSIAFAPSRFGARSRRCD